MNSVKSIKIVPKIPETDISYDEISVKVSGTYNFCGVNASVSLKNEGNIVALCLINKEQKSVGIIGSTTNKSVHVSAKLIKTVKPHMSFESWEIEFRGQKLDRNTDAFYPALSTLLFRIWKIANA